MNIIVPVKLVPDLVEEIKVDDQGASFDLDWLRLKINEFDDHAIEQAILLKESGAGQVIVIALDGDGAEDALFTAAAKGADQIIKLTGDFPPLVSNHALASWLAPLIKSLHPGLILTGVQAHNDLDGPLGPLLAEHLGIPYVGYVADVRPGESEVEVRKEFPGGLSAELEVYLPAVLGIQAAQQPPRYIAFSKIRQAMKTVTLEERPVPDVFPGDEITVRRLYQPESAAKAEMIPGDADEVASRLVDIFVEAGVL
jgi:electron transfer flavoprotein beta subunit